MSAWCSIFLMLLFSLFFLNLPGQKTHKTRARSWRWHFYSWSSTARFKCANCWSSYGVYILLVNSLQRPTSYYAYNNSNCIFEYLTDVLLCRKPCKVGIRYQEDGTKVRISRGIGASGSIIPRPEILKIRTTPRPTARMYLIFTFCNPLSLFDILYLAISVEHGIIDLMVNFN